MLFLIFPFFFCAGACKVLVKSTNGWVEGTSSYDMDGKLFYSFQSIPYAKPPLDNLRYKDPLPVDNWSGVRDATKTPPLCFQKPIFGKIVGTEDCLYLNVFTPNLNTTNPKPVAVYIHGGGFIEKTSGDYGPEFLIVEDIVIVTLNYRLAVMGFLNFDNPDVGVPGNAGLKDQVMALRWVKNNIEHFGGNPNMVTIFGESAGSCSVHLHVLSPMSQGLFHRAAGFSGTGLNTWGNGMKNSGSIFAKILGFKGDDPREMLKFLQKANRSQLEYLMHNVPTLTMVNATNGFGPTIESKHSKCSFLPDTARNLLRAGKFRKIPLILGMTNSEGILADVVSYMLANKTEPRPIETYIPYFLLEKLTSKDLESLKKDIKKFYYTSNESKTVQDIRITTDSFFAIGIYESLLGHLQHNQLVYFSQFESDTKMNSFKRMHPITAKYKGACHADDLGYMFKNLHGPVVKEGSIEDRSIRLTVKIIGNFAKYGNPTPAKGDDRLPVIWDRMDLKRWNNINIRNDTLTSSNGIWMNNFRFWCGAYKKYGSPINHICVN